MLSVVFLHIQVANAFIIHHSQQVSYQLPDLQYQISFTLCWCSFSEWSREHFTLSFAYTDSQYLIYDCLQPIAAQSTQDARLQIVDDPLTLIFRMRQGVSLSFS